jgi:chromosome partitioning protein
MAITVGFVSEKAGVGKTTACYHAAIALQRYHQLRVLVVDADYQRGGNSGRGAPVVLVLDRPVIADGAGEGFSGQPDG